MKKRFIEKRIIGFVKETEAGLAVDALYRKYGFDNYLPSLIRLRCVLKPACLLGR